MWVEILYSREGDISSTTYVDFFCCGLLCVVQLYQSLCFDDAHLLFEDRVILLSFKAKGGGKICTVVMDSGSG